MDNKFNDKKMFWANLTYFICLTLFTLLRLLNSFGVFSFLPDNISDYLFTIITQIFILFIVPMTLYIFVFKQKPKEIFREFRFKKISSKSVGYSFLLGIVVFFIIIFVSSFFSIWLQIIGYEPHTSYASGEATYANFGEFLLGILFVAVLPGIFEEFSNRGMLMSGLTKGSKLRAVVFSGLLFGLMHLNINQFFYAFVSGMIMATLIIATKSIFPSMIVHFTNNAINTYLTYANDNNLFGSGLYNIIDLSFINIPILFKFILYIIFIAFISYACIWFIYKLFIETKKRQAEKLQKELVSIRDANTQIDMDNYEDLSKFYNVAKQNGIDLIDFRNVPGVNDVSQSIVEDNSETQPQNNTPQQKNSIISKLKMLYKLIFDSDEKKYKPTFKENIFLYASVFLGAMVTIFTLIWGFL